MQKHISVALGACIIFISFQRIPSKQSREWQIKIWWGTTSKSTYIIQGTYRSEARYCKRLGQNKRNLNVVTSSFQLSQHLSPCPSLYWPQCWERFQVTGIESLWQTGIWGIATSTSRERMHRCTTETIHRQFVGTLGNSNICNCK